MIARLWHGWTRSENADRYAEFLRTQVFAELAERVAGFRGGYILRRQASFEMEFLVLTTFDSLEAVRAFAGDDYEVPVIEPEAKRLLVRGDERAVHYELVATPESLR